MDRHLSWNLKRLRRTSITDTESCAESDGAMKGDLVHAQEDDTSSDEDSDTMKVIIPVGHKGRLERSFTEVDETDEHEHLPSDSNLLEKLSQRLKERSGKVHRVIRFSSNFVNKIY